MLVVGHRGRFHQYLFSVMRYQGSYVTAVVVSVCVAGGAYCVYRICKLHQKPKLPREWKEVGTLKDLFIYPIKSCAPVIVNKAECTILGLRDGWLRDRVLMVVDEKNNFITARGFPDLLKVEPSVRNSILTLKYSEMETININLAEVIASGKPIMAQVWGIKVPVYDCGEDASKWFCRLFSRAGKHFRLVYYASENCRHLKKLAENKFYKFAKNDTGALPDEVSYHIINKASVEELNTRLKDYQVTSRTFRPNFVVAGSEPYAEDNWKFIKIGENVFETIKPCLRCLMTTIDPETGVCNTKTKTALETLRTYRQIEDPAERRSAGTAPRMGLQISLRSTPGGIISLNDKVYVA